ncbi:hypothetical protein AKJ47_00625 [candidate division MSBL1 archaeon SCGC-AAA261G05]|uniref:HAD family hydrolase n=3 Tax=candidate division MSBL1 TaxID=215777 RepID=A0A133V149_9EURY|nr:hypothetical protein AKJ42_01570 [candidate division MSBL1 archaeon SCGC-AAA261C02]KXB04141.1 hypothetical protein AKJ47_00625 [candidate division MSBL1 archaeon SCGC-AAA261G05]KXB05045.1 hypothetical protein AKJ48_00465 [candidate division MSBL1 archaeon SCGC-AAA261O19]
MDGVIYVEDSPIKGAKETIEKLRSQGRKLVFTTNNSTKTRSGYVKKLSDLGLKVNKDDIITSAYATAIYLRKKSNENGKVFVVGEEGLKSELREAGFEILSERDAENADFVIAGMDRNLNYEKIAAGLRALLAGAEFIASNPDPTYPTETGLAPGAGASIGALSGASGVEPSQIVGKPSRYMVDFALEKTDTQPEQAAIIGDRLDLDIKVGKKVGLTTILVLTGVDSASDVKKVKGSPDAPDFVLKSIRELIKD